MNLDLNEEWVELRIVTGRMLTASAGAVLSLARLAAQAVLLGATGFVVTFTTCRTVLEDKESTYMGQMNRWIDGPRGSRARTEG